MKENSIEEDIARIAKLITTKFNNDYSIDNNDTEAIEHILSDYKRVLKENEELKADRDKFKKALAKRITYCNELEKDLFENCSNYVISKQKVKDKIEELNKQLEEDLQDEIKVNSNRFIIICQCKNGLQELLDGNDTNVGSI